MTADRHDTASRVRRAAAVELAKYMPFDPLITEHFLELAEEARLTLPEIISLIEAAIAANHWPGDEILRAMR